jgi:hypothetical protein
MRRRYMAASLETGTLQECIQPLLEMRELLNVQASPF